MSCVFPGSKNADEFWINLINEKDLIQEIPRIAGIGKNTPKAKETAKYIRNGAALSQMPINSMRRFSILIRGKQNSWILSTEFICRKPGKR